MVHLRIEEVNVMHKSVEVNAHDPTKKDRLARFVRDDDVVRLMRRLTISMFPAMMRKPRKITRG